jgi:hypothetical protein
MVSLELEVEQRSSPAEFQYRDPDLLKTVD